ncbi:hypothetical protein TNCV_1588381 [Trichonephila clavipes]|uniref:Uncharacterized protein n=1 Tax=Trichonephila clavipes TaxID=2585209 RepID=A0A8X6UUY2_TRICX|nr:hypothetical protein TNCV_1588381 [Trichonephila clavipes]
MIPSSSFVNPTPLAQVDTPRDVLARVGTSHTVHRAGVQIPEKAWMFVNVWSLCSSGTLNSRRVTSTLVSFVERGKGIGGLWPSPRCPFSN